MGKGTGIQFADDTANGMGGCDGCELWRPARVVAGTATGYELGATQRPDGRWWIRICYAGVLTDKLLSNGPLKGWTPSFDTPTLFPGRIEKTANWKDLTGTKREDKPWLNGMPRVIFCDDIGDRWTASLPIDSLAPTLPVIARAPHLYWWFTKRPDRAAEFSQQHTLPDNVWIFTTITSAQDARLRALERVKAARIGVSYEPILGDAAALIRRHPRIAMWIFGGASGVEAAPTNIAIIRDGVDACRAVGAAAFVKQLGARPFEHREGSASGSGPGYRFRMTSVEIDTTFRLRDTKGGDWNEWPEDLRVREYPR